MLKATFGLVLVLVFSVLYFYLKQSGSLELFFNREYLLASINQYKQWGPALIIVLMSSAIIMSPIPSAPIALASGAAYGHTWGTIYILIGAELGAIIAFSIARLLGYEAMNKRFGDKININWLRSDNKLMLIVGLSRLVPFISFDVVSYAAGLTSLSYLRFATATLLGIIPASFLLAHFGNEMVTTDLPNMFVTILLLGGITAIPILIGWLIRYRPQH